MRKHIARRMRAAYCYRCSVVCESICVSVCLLCTNYTTRPDPTKQSCLCRVCIGGVNWILDNSRLSPTENLNCKHVNSNCLIHTATPDTTGLFCRVLCGGVNWVSPTARHVPSVSGLRRNASGGRSGLCATQNVNTLWAWWLLHMTRPNFFTKRHATKVIYRLTVQTLPDCLETHFTPLDTTQTGPSCHV